MIAGFLWLYLMGCIPAITINFCFFDYWGYRLAGRVLFWPAFVVKFVVKCGETAVFDLLGDLV